MARFFLPLQLTLLRNRARLLREDSNRVRALVVTAAVVVFFVVQVGPGFLDNLSSTGELPEPEEFLAMMSFSAVFLWVAMPLTFAGRRDLDVSRFQLLPLRPSQIVAGIATTWVVSPWVWLTAAGAAVVVSSFDAPVTSTVLMALGAVALVLLCAVAGRVTITGADLLAQQRRARDLLMLLSVGVGIVPLVLAWQTADQFDHPEKNSVLADTLSVLPPAWPGRAIAAAGAEKNVEALLSLAGTAVLVGLCWWAWVSLVGRSLLAENASTTRRERDGDPFGSFGRWVGGRRGAVASAEGRLIWREPGRLPNTLLFAVLIGGMATALAAAVYGSSNAHLAALGVVGLTIVTMGRRGNELGVHAPALWQNVIAPGRSADDLVGRDLAALWIDGILVGGAAVIITAITGGWLVLPGILVAGGGAILVSYAIVRIIAVRLAQPAPSAKDGGPNQTSGQNPLVSVATIVAWGVTMAPVFAVLSVPAALGEGWLALAAPLAFLYGAALWWVTLRWLGRWLDEHQADLLNQLTR